jgi:hypothetical protein
MPNTNESGHAINVANFETLIGFCTSFGTAYNPANASLKLVALTAQHAAAKAAIGNLEQAKTNHDNATNSREIVFYKIKPLSTRMLNALSASGAASQTVDDARSVNRKIQGRRATPGKKADPEAREGEPAPKKVSASQQGFNNLIGHFSQFIKILEAEPLYKPNEEDLKVVSLKALLNELSTRNSDVMQALAALKRTRINRDEILYRKDTGICDVAQSAKSYMKSLFSSVTPQFKQFGALRFKKTSR